MGLVFIFILVPASIILLVWGSFTVDSKAWRYLGLMWLCVIGLGCFGLIMDSIRSPIKLEKEDYYGHYIIDRSYFPGEQADWQYNNFRFEIRDNDSIYFHITDEERIIKTYIGYISTKKPYISERLIINIDTPGHHILSSNPTTYRSRRDFYLVFNSPEFYNVFFRKGKWQKIYTSKSKKHISQFSATNQNLNH